MSYFSPHEQPITLHALIGTIRQWTRNSLVVFSAVAATVLMPAAMAGNPPQAKADLIRVKPSWSSIRLVGGAISVLANDVLVAGSDPALFVAKLDIPPAHGTVQLNADGSFNYQHDGSAANQDTFTYQACDVNGCDFGKVSIEVISTSNSFLSIPDSIELLKGGAASTLLDSRDNLMSLAVEMTPLLFPQAPPPLAPGTCYSPWCSISLVAAPSHGVLTLNPDGTFLYAHDGSSATQDSFDYSVCDANGCVSDTIGILILDPNLTEAPVSLSASYFGTCALTTLQRAKCWGANDNPGTIGQWPASALSQAVYVRDRTGNPLGDIQQIALGNYHICVLQTNGTVQCAGGNDRGQLGRGYSDTQMVPHPPGYVSGLGPNDVDRAILLVAGNAHTCALLRSSPTARGAVKCWGSNHQLQSGQPNPSAPSGPNVTVPAKVAGLPSDVVSVVGGSYHTCALTRTSVWCWGVNGLGELGRSTGPLYFDLPALSATSLIGVKKLVSGPSADHNCAILANGEQWCWGRYESGQFGNGQSAPGQYTAGTFIPSQVLGNLYVSKLAVGALNTCAILSPSGSISCWGDGGYGELTDPNFPQLSAVPFPTSISSGATDVSVGAGMICAIVNSQVKCWGINDDVALGRGPSSYLISVSATPATVFGF